MCVSVFVFVSVSVCGWVVVSVNNVLVFWPFAERFFFAEVGSFEVETIWLSVAVISEGFFRVTFSEYLQMVQMLYIFPLPAFRVPLGTVP